MKASNEGFVEIKHKIFFTRMTWPRRIQELKYHTFTFDKNEKLTQIYKDKFQIFYIL